MEAVTWKLPQESAVHTLVKDGLRLFDFNSDVPHTPGVPGSQCCCGRNLTFSISVSKYLFYFPSV